MATIGDEDKVPVWMDFDLGRGVPALEIGRQRRKCLKGWLQPAWRVIERDRLRVEFIDRDAAS